MSTGFTKKPQLVMAKDISLSKETKTMTWLCISVTVSQFVLET